MTNTEMAKHLAEKVSQSFALVTRPSGPPTVVIRSPKSRPSVVSLDKGVLELTPEVSPETSGEISGNSSKQSGQNNVPPRTNSTGMTSMESKLSAGKKLLSGHSSDTKKGGAFGGGALIKTPNTKQLIAEETAISPGLTPIAEQAQEAVIPLPVPSESFHPRRGIVCPSTPSQLLNSCAAVITVEKAAAAKIFFECHYNTLLASGPSPRSIRRRDFEALLYENAPILSQQNIEDRRRDWQARESRYLREIRVMKSRNLPRKKGVDPMVNQYEVVKVLGKGSFGVVRLVREKEDVEVQGAISPVAQLRRKNEVYAMKVIRKSDMLRNSQEGHLRAERDFLVASEGSRW